MTVMEAVPAKPLSSTERVVYATVCEHCESVVGKEVVREVKASWVEAQLKTNPENFFQYKDARHNASYRQVSTVHSCIQC